jgi:DNA-binding MarR family transcriptional regulator
VLRVAVVGPWHDDAMNRPPVRRFTPVERRYRGYARDRLPAEYEAGDPALAVARIIRLRGYLEGLHRAACTEVGLAPDVGRLLLVLAERRIAERPTDIAASLGVSRATLSRLLVKAEALGWVERRPMAGSDRETMVFITKEGRLPTRQLEAAVGNRVRQAIVRDNPDLPALNAELHSFESAIEPQWSPFEHAATSSKWRSRRWTEDTGWGDDFFLPGEFDDSSYWRTA